MLVSVFLGLTSLLFFAFGTWSIIDPAGMTRQLQVVIDGPSGLFEMRGVFGGVSLGAAILCLMGTLLPRFAFPALCFVTAYMGGYVIGRLASLIAGDTAASSSWMFAGCEALIFVLALILLMRQN